MEAASATESRVEVGIEGEFVVSRAEGQDPGYVWVQFFNANKRKRREFSMELNGREVGQLVRALQPHAES
jgi:hypothetical protein